MKPLAFVLFWLASTSTWAGWSVIGSTGNADVYVDSATIRQQDTLVKMWTLLDFNNIQQVAEGAYLSQAGQQEFDCDGDKYRTLSTSIYSGHMGGGQVVFSSDEPDAVWEPVAPGTVGEGFWKIACGK